MTYSIFDIANWFLNKQLMTPKKLQKLCYYAEAWCQTLLDKDLIGDTKFQAWVHGPVSPELFHKYKDYRWNTIDKVEEINQNLLNNEPVINVLESVWFTYGNKSANELEALTHEDTPWIDARKRANASINDSCTEIITPSDMKNFYRNLYHGD